MVRHEPTVRLTNSRDVGEIHVTVCFKAKPLCMRQTAGVISVGKAYADGFGVLADGLDMFMLPPPLVNPRLRLFAG